LAPSPAISTILAVIAVTLRLANASLVVFAGTEFTSALVSSCTFHRPGAMFQIEESFSLPCSNLGLAIDILAACSFALTVLLSSQELYRGIKDVGFVGS
jgi:hypothetical protein